MDKDETQIILFDGVCNLCNSAVRFVINRDPNGKFKYASLQSEHGKSLLLKFGLRLNDYDTFILIREGKYFSKSTAALLVLSELGGVWRLWYVFMYLPRPIRDFIYGVIAKSRYRIFGRRSDCMVPTVDIQNRFLE